MYVKETEHKNVIERRTRGFNFGDKNCKIDKFL